MSTMESWLAEDAPVDDELKPTASLWKKSIRIGGGRVKAKDIEWMADKLATTQGAGVTVYRAVNMLSRMRPNDAIGDRLRSIQAQLSEGSTLGAAMRTHEKDFGALVCSLVEAGEGSGTLTTAFRKVADLVGARVRLTRKIRGALLYPISVSVIATVIITGMILFIVPIFEGIFTSVDSELPLLTRILVASTDYAPGVLVVVAVLAAVLIYLLRRSRTDLRIRRVIDTNTIRLPLLGGLIRKGINARIASTLASLVRAGVPLLQALEYAGDAAGNLLYKDALMVVVTEVSDGSTLSRAVARQSLFPPLMVELSAVGEDTGDLSTLLERYADDAEDEVSVSAEALTRIVEPLMMVVLGAVVGVFLLGLYLPIINIGNQIK